MVGGTEQEIKYNKGWEVTIEVGETELAGEAPERPDTATKFGAPAVGYTAPDVGKVEDSPGAGAADVAASMVNYAAAKFSREETAHSYKTEPGSSSNKIPRIHWANNRNILSV